MKKRELIRDNNLWHIVAKASAKEHLWLPLTWHLEDTAQVMEYLVRSWISDGFFRGVRLSKEDVMKTGIFLAMVHDLGKATPCFQEKITEDFPELKDALTSTGLLTDSADIDLCKVKHAYAGAILLKSSGLDESVSVIIESHHGKPDSGSIYRISPKDEIERYQDAYGKESAWKDVQVCIIQNALHRSGYKDLSDLPKLSEEAQVALSALLIVADWLSSNSLYFPLISTHAISKAYDKKRAEDALQNLKFPKQYHISDDWKRSSFMEDRFGFSANDVQKETILQASKMEHPGLMIVEAPMGAGKTEAALAAAEIMMNRFSLGGIAFFLPSQATSNSMFDRILFWVRRQKNAEPAVMELTHGNARLCETFRELKDGCISTAEDEDDPKAKAVTYSFFDRSKTKLLADVVIGTVDQLLMAALRQKHVMLRHLGLIGKVVVIDEVHAYDAYMNVYLDRILQWLSMYEVPVILLSATLPGERRAELVQAYSGCKKTELVEVKDKKDYPLITTCVSRGEQRTGRCPFQMRSILYGKKSKQVKIEKQTAKKALREIKRAMDAGGCVGIILNTVDRVEKFADIVERKFPDARLCVLHSRFLLPDRIEKEKEILRLAGKMSTMEDRKKLIVVASQVIEQSMDLDFDLLITDLCPMDLLLQRIGRAQRHERVRPKGFEEAKCIVLECDPDHLEHGARAIYGEYLLRRTIEVLPDVICLPDDISGLIQRVYDREDGKKLFPSEYEEYLQKEQRQKKDAKAYCLRMPDEDPYAETITSLLVGEAHYGSEEKAKAAVRDGEASLEVLALKERKDGFMEILSGEHKGEALDPLKKLSLQEIDILSRQKIRLPARLSNDKNYESTIHTLAKAIEEKISVWTKQPALSGELLMILNPDGDISFGDLTYHYDLNRGFFDG